MFFIATNTVSILFNHNFEVGRILGIWRRPLAFYLFFFALWNKHPPVNVYAKSGETLYYDPWVIPLLLSFNMNMGEPIVTESSDTTGKVDPNIVIPARQWGGTSWATYCTNWKWPNLINLFWRFIRGIKYLISLPCKLACENVSCVSPIETTRPVFEQNDIHAFS